MKAQIAILVPLSIAVCVGSFALMKMRMKEFNNEEKKVKFQDVRLRVTEDVLSEYGKELQLIESGTQKEKDKQEVLHKALNELNDEPLKTELQACASVCKKITDNIASIQMELKTVQDVNAKEKGDWEAEIAALNEKLNKQSPICDYIKAGSSVPGICPEKKPEPKPEPPKPQEQKPDAPKPEEAKPAPQKPEEAKPDAPKPEEPKKEAA